MHQAADRFRQCLRTLPSDEDLAATGSLIARLAAFQTALENAGPSPTESLTVTPPGSQLFTGQFRLATREDEQERHTLGGGFCPLHTWQYASVASPLGISAGYGPIAAVIAPPARPARGRLR